MTSKEGEAGAAPSRTQQAKQLLAQYGSAYLITSISFAIVSFAACYAAVSSGDRAHAAQATRMQLAWGQSSSSWQQRRGLMVALALQLVSSAGGPSSNTPGARIPSPLTPAGVDVAALLARVGLTVSDTSEKVGTFAIAYAAHKALSPVRFPPTVALTPVVAKWLGKKPAADAEGSEQQ